MTPRTSSSLTCVSLLNNCCLDGAISVRQAQALTIRFNALVRRSALSHPSGR